MISHELVLERFNQLRTYVEREEFMGWDPYDGLASSLFQATPMRYSRLLRLAWIQFFKRSPVNLRKLLAVPRMHNPKGLALFLCGYVNLYRQAPDPELKLRIEWLTEKIKRSQSAGYAGACWGYPFDWQARAFLQPAGTPTVVATSYVGYALLDAFELLGDRSMLDLARSACDFVLQDLKRTYDGEDFCFSYSPLDNTQVFNASLLASKLLARVYHHTHEEILKREAQKSVSFCCRRQAKDGSWSYGTLPFHSWVDNFHTGFNLECLADYARSTGDLAFQNHFEKGLEYYLNTFFLPDGRCRYYSHELYPMDIHSPAQAIILLIRTGRVSLHRKLVDAVLGWTLKNMQSAEGYFYYQVKRFGTSRIPYMRWAQAWMFCALAFYLSLPPDDATN